MDALILEIETPPGPPWSQHQIARLQAQHRSPLPLDRVEILLARRAAWRLGGSGAFYAAILRAEDAPPVGDDLEQLVDGVPVLFKRQGAIKREATPLLVIGLLALVTAAALTVAVTAAGKVEPVRSPKSALAGSPAKQRVAAQNAQVVDDLIAARDAFGSTGGLQALEWTPEALVVQTARTDVVQAVGDGRAFEKLSRVEGSNVDRWRLEHGAR